jgi:hypothetical protein
MNEIKYFSGDPHSFWYKSYSEKIFRKEKIIVFEAVKISYVLGTIKDNSGIFPLYENFNGKVYMRKDFMFDIGFMNFENFKTFNDDRKKLPMKGFYQANENTKLCLDIDEMGQVWLTDQRFDKKKLVQKLSELNINLNRIQNQIKEIKEELWEIEIDEGNKAMYKQAEKDIEEAFDRGYTNMIEDIANDEIRQMNKESDGLWDID